MPYTVVKKSGAKPFKIVNKQTGKVVGSSDSKAKAVRSIGYRMAAEGKKGKAKRTMAKVDKAMKPMMGKKQMMKPDEMDMPPKKMPMAKGRMKPSMLSVC